ncbi:SulP family inorganic anion transporter [bacterium]|nr:SulP family inorganic anion transporter [bacterium]
MQTPADGVAGLKKYWVDDLLSGFIIFLIALPLSLGIALASGAPASAGIIAAMVGGILGSILGGSFVTINGPAAGLIVIVVGAVNDLGAGDMATGFKKMLAACVIAGILQIISGVFRLGILGVAVPSSVIHGMMTAIGFIILAKQLPVALGVAAHAKSPLGLIAELPSFLQQINPEVALIAMTGLAIIMGFKLFKGSWAKYVPAPLVVVIAGMYLARIFDFDHAHMVMSHWVNMEVGPKFLLNIPANLASAIIFPDFSSILSPTSIRYIVMLFLVASIESLLSATAVDRIDPYKRVANLDRELISKGICNLTCGLIGGMPIIAEIVRSSANVRNGAKTRWANFYHGVFILAFVGLFPHIIHEIPLSALAAILISVGYTLAQPGQFIKVAEVGGDHLLAFATTFVITVAEDLLVGVAAGIVVEIVVNMVRGTRPANLFKAAVTEHVSGNYMKLSVTSGLVFSNFLTLKNKLDNLGKVTKVMIDLSDAPTVDHTVLEHLHRYQAERQAAGHEFELAFSSDHKAVSKHPLAARKRTTARSRA